MPDFERDERHWLDNDDATDISEFPCVARRAARAQTAIKTDGLVRHMVTSRKAKLAGFFVVIALVG
jgi:hypothetical protein